MSDLRVSIIDNVEDWCGMASEWNGLLDESRSSSFFLTWEWLFSWAECFLKSNRRLFILVFRDEEKLVGIAPLYIEQKRKGLFTLRELHFLGMPEAASDYLEVFMRIKSEKAVADTLYDYLTTGEGSGAWDMAELAGIPANSLFLMHLMERFRLAGRYAEFVAYAYCPVVRLPSNESEFHAQLSTERRRSMNREFRVIHREREVVHEVLQGDEVASRLSDFFYLFEEKRGRSGAMLQPFIRRLVEKYPGESPVQVDLLSINGQLVAGLLHFKYQDTMSGYLMGLDKNFNPKVSLGGYLIAQSIKSAIKKGYVFYDFLRGIESYKFSWANEGHQMVQLNFWQKRPAALVFSFVRLARHAGKLLLR